MWLTIFNRAPWWYTLMFISIGPVLCQEGPCSQQLMAQLTSMLEEKFVEIGNRLSGVEGALGNVALLDEKFLEMGNRLLGVEHALGGVEKELTFVKGMTQNIEIEAVAFGERSSQNQILQEKTFRNLDNIKDDLSQEMQELKSQVSLLEDNLNESLENTTSLLHKEYQETTNNSYELIIDAIEEYHEVTNNTYELINDAIEDLKTLHDREAGTMNTTVNNLESSYERDVSTMNTTFNDLKTRHERDVSTMNTTFNDLEREVANIKINVNNDVAEVKTTINNLESEIADIKINVKSDVAEFKTTMNNLESEVADIKINVKSDVAEVKSTMNNLESEVADIKMNVKSDVAEVKTSINNLESEVATIKINVKSDVAEVETNIIKLLMTCPGEGFFRILGTSQCVKVYRDQKRTWDAAQAHCNSQGLQLVKPVDALGLMAYLNKKYSENRRFWIGGRGDNIISNFRFWRDGAVLRRGNPLWGSGEPDSVASTSCLRLDAIDSDVKAATPYWDEPCSGINYHICERAMG